MRISTMCARGAVGVYKTINKTGFLKLPFAQLLHIICYFNYKRYIHDPYARLVKYHGHLFKGGNILDIGANIGYTSFVFSKVLEKPFKIFAFEPELKNMVMLKKASQKYQFSASIVPIAAAVGDKDGEIELWQNEANNADHRILTNELKKKLSGPIKTQTIPVVKVDSYLKKIGENIDISFIKIDVQGYELSVCKGMLDTIIRNPDAVIGFEYSPNIIESLGYQPEDLLQFFRERGYNFYILNKKNKIQPYVTELLSIKPMQTNAYDYIDIICARRNLVG